MARFPLIIALSLPVTYHITPSRSQTRPFVHAFIQVLNDHNSYITIQAHCQKHLFPPLFHLALRLPLNHIYCLLNPPPCCCGIPPLPSKPGANIPSCWKPFTPPIPGGKNPGGGGGALKNPGGGCILGGGPAISGGGGGKFAMGNPGGNICEGIGMLLRDCWRPGGGGTRC